MHERLPPQGYSQEVNYPPVYHTPRVQTRSGGQRGERVQPPIQRVGDASARVIRYNNKDEDDTVAAHFVADVSNFTSNQNPRLRNSNGIFQIWRPEPWIKAGNFHLENMEGIVTVQKEGLYHIYAQVLLIINLNYIIPHLVGLRKVECNCFSNYFLFINRFTTMMKTSTVFWWKFHGVGPLSPPSSSAQQTKALTLATLLD
jgi:hypothetical protein